MTNSIKPLVLRTVMGTYGHTWALKEGAVASARLDLQFTEVEPITEAFARMVRGQEYDVAELAITTYFLARAFGKPVTAIPAVLVRSFHHGGITVNVNSGVKKPTDLEGKRVGLRSYGQTSGVWARGILQHEYGVDLSKVTWVLIEDEHVQEFQPAATIVRHPHRTRNLEQMLLSGEVDAALGVRAQDNILPLIPDAEQAEAAWFQRTGIYPVNHVVSIKESVLAANPWLSEELFGVLKASKEVYLQRLKTDGPVTNEDQQRAKQQSLVGADPLPYGIEANRRGLDTLLQYAYEQRITPRLFTAEEMFAPGAARLT